MAYKVTIIKNGKGKKTGDIANPVDLNSYKVLYDLGLIEDEHNLIVKEKKEKKEKTDQKQDKKINKKNNNLKDN